MLVVVQVEYFMVSDDNIKALKKALEQLYVVENLVTGEKYVTDAMSAYKATWEPNRSLMNAKRRDDIKIYPLSDVSSAAKILFSK